MIKLSNVSSDEAFYLQPGLWRFAMKNECYNVEQLKSLINDYPEFNWKDVKLRIEKIEKIVNKCNKRGVEPEIYAYDNKGIELVDRLNYGDVLLLGNPIINSPYRYREVKPCSIYRIKQNLSLTDSYGLNILRRTRSVGKDSVLKIVKALERYDEQVLRQAELTDKRNYNLFYKDKKAKNKIVEDLYSDIILYLIYNTEEKTIWGDLSETQKKSLISSVINKKAVDYIVKDRMINVISNYTTLPELEQVAKGNQKVLKRFIEK